jgi:hypothetical protein
MLRDQPLPDISLALSEKIRGEAHQRLRAAQRRSVGRRIRGWSLAAAVLFVCISNLGWTWAFMERVQVPATAVSVLR